MKHGSDRTFYGWRALSLRRAWRPPSASTPFDDSGRATRRCRSLGACAFLILLTLASSIHAQAGKQEPPVAGRPEDFSGLVGVFRINASATPMELQVEDPLTLTVRIGGEPDRSFQSPEPLRSRLRLFSKRMQEDFFIEPVPEKDRHLEKEKMWEFVYRLRPKRLDAKSIPGLKLTYYLPARRRYQSSYADEIELTVTPRPEAAPTKAAIDAARLPERFYELVTGPDVLRRPLTIPWLIPAAAIYLLLPPALCALWYRRWRRLHPDEGRYRQQQRSQAAQKALRLLHDEPGPNEEQVFLLLAGYLWQRFDLVLTEPTPREVAHHLNRLGISRDLRTRVADFIARCDAVRFAPVGKTSGSRFAEEAAQLIHALEAESQRADASSTAVRASGGAKPRPSPIIPVLVLLVLTGTAIAHTGSHAAVPDADLLRSAEAEFQKGKEAADKPAQARTHFAAAAHHFDELRKRGIANPDLCRNLGNAELLAGNLGAAIFAYRQGLRLSPNDSALRANLEYARSRVRYPSSGQPPDLPWLPSHVLVLALSLGLYTLGCVALTRRLIKGRGTWRVTVLFSGALLAGLGLAWLQWHDWQQERYPLVVIARDGVSFVRGNGESYPPHAEVPTLNAGVESRRLFQRGDWLQIRLPGGEVGWVKKDSALVE